jgi:hypothetical protein
LVGLGLVGLGLVGLGLVGLGLVGLGLVGLGLVGLGLIGLGLVGLGLVGLGFVWLGLVGLGWVRLIFPPFSLFRLDTNPLPYEKEVSVLPLSYCRCSVPLIFLPFQWCPLQFTQVKQKCTLLYE